MQSPSVRRRERAQSRPPGGLPFASEDVPDLQFWQDYTSIRAFEGPAADVLLNTAVQYCTLALRGSVNWRHTLQKDHNIDCYTLHHTAIPLLTRPAGNAASLGMHMFMTASSLKYAPSTLTLMRMLTGYKRSEFAKHRPKFRDAEMHFRSLLQTDKSPDVLTLQGFLLLCENREAQALKYFDLALQTSNSNLSEEEIRRKIVRRKPRWTYEASCHLKRGAILSNLGRKEEAAASFRIAAYELDVPEAFVQLARLLPKNAPETEICLAKAAQAGDHEACEILALHAINKAADSRLSRADRGFNAKMAREWALLVPDPAKREDLESLLAGVQV
ncbi:hypothetical protein VTK26DRAFT_5218 [Humicola hyalothermophila]